VPKGRLPQRAGEIKKGHKSAARRDQKGGGNEKKKKRRAEGRQPRKFDRGKHREKRVKQVHDWKPHRRNGGEVKFESWQEKGEKKRRERDPTPQKARERF